MNQTTLLLLIGVEKPHQQLGLQRPRAEGIDSDSFSSVDHRQLSGHGKHSTLRGGVCHLRRCRPDQGHEGRSVDDRAPARPAQSRDGVFAPQEHAFGVDVHGQIPYRFFSGDRVVIG